MTDDGQLLQQYTRERSESAFGELVTRHIDLVYSAALRVAGGDRHLAEDVTQVVFMDLARKARGLPRDVLLAGWLHRHTCYTAAKAVRTERRRKTRERIAMEMRSASMLASIKANSLRTSIRLRLTFTKTSRLRKRAYLKWFTTDHTTN